MKHLVINADDFGLVDSVNRGIAEAVAHGVVTSASLLVNMPGCQTAIARLADLLRAGHKVTVGLHLNLVGGTPLSSCPTLVDHRSGRFLALPSLAIRAFRGRIAASDVEREVSAQLDRAASLLQPLGLRVSHLDSHRHAHCLPTIYDVVVAAAKRSGIHFVRHPYETPVLVKRPRALLAAGVLRVLVSERANAGNDGVHSVRFTGLAAMRSKRVESDFAAIVAALPSGATELMVHPGYDSPELAAIDSYRLERERELRALMSPAFRERIQESGVKLASFDSIAPPA